MAFDKIVYRDEFLRPKSRQKPLALDDDLLQRYAISLPTTESEIGETLRAVRSFWNSQQNGTPMYKYAKLCLGDDERLKDSTVGSGPSKRGMLSIEWWEAQKSSQDGAALDRITKLSALLKDANGSFGVITRSYLERCAERVPLEWSQANRAARDAGLEVIEDVPVPDDPPIAQYAALETDLGVAGVPTICELIHPESGPFRIVDRFESVGNPELHLDVAAIADQALEASKKGTTATWDARRSALNILRSASEAGVDLRLIALYQLVQAVVGGAVPGAAGIKAELRSRGLDERDANILAVVLGDRVGSTATQVVQRAEELLQDGRLREAAALVEGLPQDGSDSVKQLLKRVSVARAKCGALLTEARQLLAVPDEIGAAAKVREAETISSEDAEEMLALIPLSPPRDFRLDADGSTVRLHWQPNAGHTEATTYQVVRSADGPPKTPVNGSPLGELAGTTITDRAAFVARPTFYGVFAEAPGRPTSRPAHGDLILVPPVLEARCESGPDRVSAHWATHPGAHHVDAIRRETDTTSPVPVDHSSATVSGLPEGVSVHIELTAVYETPEGAPLRSASVVVSGTSRAAARPIESLRAHTIVSPTGVQVRVSWKPIDRSDVRLKRHSSAPRWPVGTMVTAEEMGNWGTEVTGTTEASPGMMQLDASLPAGSHHLLPFSIGGTGIVVGRGVSVGVTDPVSALTATPFAGFARLAWTWPESSRLAEVSWERDDIGVDAVGLEQVSSAVYDSRGVTVPLGSAPCEVSVRALMVVDGESYASPPATITVRNVSHASVRYSVISSPGLGFVGGRSKWISVSAEEDVSSLRLVMIAAPGPVLPSQPSDGLTIMDETMSLTRGQPKKFNAKVPKAVGRKYWVRCFLVSGDAELEDPPLNTLKEG